MSSCAPDRCSAFAKEKDWRSEYTEHTTVHRTKPPNVTPDRASREVYNMFVEV